MRNRETVQIRRQCRGGGTSRASRSGSLLGTDIRRLGACVPCGLSSRAVAALLLSPPLYEVDYFAVEHTKIYVGQSRHWVVAWLWFLS